MAVLLENRTISMILMVPDVEVTPPSSTPIIEQLDRSDIDSVSTMPVYQGSIVRIEKHHDDHNISDLIIRVPNFQRLSSPSSDTNSRPPSRMKRRAPICPIMNGPTPHLSTTNNTHNINSLNLNQTQTINSNRLTTGLRSLSRAFTHSCKTKRSSSISEVQIPSSLPDVEVITEKFQRSINKNSKTSIPKLVPPKILFVKRKNSKIKKKQLLPSSSSLVSHDTQTDLEQNHIHLTPTSTIITTQYTEIRKTNSPKITSFMHRYVEQDEIINQPKFNVEEDDEKDDKEQQNDSIGLGFDVEQQFAAISQLISDNPISSIDDESLSTHRYSTISVNAPDIRISVTDFDQENISSPIIHPTSTGISYDFKSKPSSLSTTIPRSYRVQTSLLQPDISVIRIGTNNLTTGIDRHLPGEKISNEQQIDSIINNQQEEKIDNHIEQDWYEINHSDDETFAECYEVTYQVDPEFYKRQKQNTDQSSLPIKITLDPFEYKTLTTTSLPPNEYEQIEHDNSIEQKSQQSDEKQNNLEIISKEQETLINNIIRNKSHSVDDLSRTSNDQTATYQPESISSSSSSSENSSRHCSLKRSNSYEGFGIYVSTNDETSREHFIHQIEEYSPGEQAGLKENDRILCINGTPVIDEEYTVVLQLLKHGLQTDTLDFDVITNDAYEQFKKEIDQLYQ